MAAYHIQRPYVMASLPRSLAQDGQYFVGEVYGHRPDGRRRRRPEVVVGIDGESANLFDVASSKTITSYPIPPQARFSCSPCSVRQRVGAGPDGKERTAAGLARYTYLATREPAKKQPQLSLFLDMVDASGAMGTTKRSVPLDRNRHIVGLAAVPSASARQSAPLLLAVDRHGLVTCFDGDSLAETARASLATLARDVLPAHTDAASLRVELVQLSTAADVLKGLQLGDDYLAGVYAQKVTAGGFNPLLLLLLSAVGGTRTLHLLAWHEAKAGSGHGPALIQVHHLRLPSMADTAATTSPLYRLDVTAGSLFALHGERLVSLDLARSVPRLASQMIIPGVTSFLRLSPSSVLASTTTTVAVYNPLFRSLQASVELAVAADSATTTTTAAAPLLVAYFSQLELAVALVGSALVAVQLEAPRVRSKKRRADGLLIDSIGRGVAVVAADETVVQVPETEAKEAKPACLPGTVSAGYLQQYTADVQTADRLLAEADVAGFDDFLAEKLGIQAVPKWRWQRPLEADAEESHGSESESEGDDNGRNRPEAETATPTSKPSPSHRRYPEADRRWVVYALGRLLSVTRKQQKQGLGAERLQLWCPTAQSRILNYLVDAGHLSVGNTQSALVAAAAADAPGSDSEALGMALPALLAQVDPSLDLLLRWLHVTPLGATELLSAVLLLMRSLELVGAAEGDDDDDDDDDADAETGETEAPTPHAAAIDRLDQQVRLAEYFLQQADRDQDPRDLALEVAIAKLGNCPAQATVQGLRRLFRTSDVRALIEVLRKQLVDQGWASRYVEGAAAAAGEVMDVDADADADDADSRTPLNGSIRLIADLLCRCIDAVRPGEWLVDDVPGPLSDDGRLDSASTAAAAAAITSPASASAVWTGDSLAGDFFASLKWQVSAALEGVQEALYLRGILGEAVRYATAVQKVGAVVAAADAKDAAEKEVGRPQRVLTRTAGPSMLPLGLKAPVGLSRHEDVAPTKVQYGGEVVRRSRRELGMLTSRKVGPYTQERIVV